MMKHSVSLFIVIIILAGFGMVNASNDAGNESLFSTGAGARALGFGGGFTSLADDASAVFYNPAGLPNLEIQEVSLMHMTLFEGTIYNYAGWVYPDAKLGGVGIAFMRVGTDEIIRRSEYLDNGSFDYSFSQLMIAYGKRLQGGISVGLTFKLVNQSLDNMSDYGIGIDVGMKANLNKYISAGLLMRDMIPPELELENKSEITPISVVGGIGIQRLPLSQETVLNASFELEKIENRSTKIHTGLELFMHDAYAMRAGYDRDNLSFGVGVKINRLKFDYAYKILEYIDDSHRFSLSFLIGTSIPEQMRLKEQLEREKGTVLLEDERVRQFSFYKEKADNYYNQYRLDSAQVYYQRALAFDEQNPEIIGILAAIENIISIQQEEQQKITETRRELQKSIENYLTQAENFFNKKYYRASLDMLDLIFDIEPNQQEAKVLKRLIEDAVSRDIEEELANAKKAEGENNYLKALESYNRILDLDPGNEFVVKALEQVASNLDIAQQLNKGIELYNLNEITKAKATFNAVLSLDSKNPVALEYLKKIAVTEEKTTTLEDLQSDKVVWQMYLDGLRYMRNKEYEKAIEIWNKVLEAYPNNINTINNIEQAQLRLKSEKDKE